MTPAGEAVARFAADLDGLVAPGGRVGVAVSGGGDSLALLLLATAARPGLIAAASVDHALRDGSRAEAEAVARLCGEIDVPHAILSIDWPAPPHSAVQEQARDARYAALGEWAVKNGLAVVATGHHADDQAETLVMRLMRGAGVRGLAAMRVSAPMPGSDDVRLIRPLLGWRRGDLAAVVADAGVTPADDPSNHDDHHERVRVRRLIAASPWLDPAALARSCAHLGAADEAINYAVAHEWARVRTGGEALYFEPLDTPAEIRRRVVARIIGALASEGNGAPLRGREVNQLLARIEQGGSATLRGVRASGGTEWCFTRSPPRR